LILIVGGYGFGFRSIMALHPCRGLSFPSKSPNSVESVVLAGGMTNTSARSVDGSRESLLVVRMNYGLLRGCQLGEGASPRAPLLPKPTTVAVVEGNAPFGLWHVLAARGDARPPQIASLEQRFAGIRRRQFCPQKP
jgi:hypothetical protein